MKDTRKTIRNILIGIFFVITFAVLVWFNMSKPRILVLHSYNPEYSWTYDLGVGIKRGFGSRTNFHLRTYYLDTKRHPWPEYKASAGKIARRVINEWKPDIIIASDDDAQNFVTKHFVNDQKTNIIFCGVNNELKDYGFDKANNVTGILERLPLAAVKDSLSTYWERKGNKSPIRVIFLGDESETVKGDARWVKEYDWSPLILSDVILVNNFDDWMKVVLNAHESTDFIVNSNYRKISRQKDSKELVSAKELIEWTEANSKIPVIGTNAFYPEDGGMLAIATSPFEQGEVAAKMAVQMMEDKMMPKDIKVKISHQFVVSMSESRVKNRNFSLPLVYEASARASDKFYK